MAALASYAFVAAVMILFWPAGSASRYYLPMVLPLAAWRFGVNAVACFWAAYSLTRPLGASVADGLAVATHATPPGLGWTTGVVTAIGLVLFALLVGYLALTHSDVEGAHAQHEREHQYGDLPVEVEAD